jgi:hypothetical protein
MTSSGEWRIELFVGFRPAKARPAREGNAQNGRMKRALAILRTALFLVVAPAIVAGVIPWWNTRWHSLTAPAD